MKPTMQKTPHLSPEIKNTLTPESSGYVISQLKEREKARQDKDWKKDEKLYHFLDNLDAENSYNENDYASYGILLQPGMDKNQVVNHIVNKVKEVLIFLNESIAK